VHLALHLSKRFPGFVFVSFLNFYGGPPGGLTRKLSTGLKNILFDRITMSRKHGFEQISIRKLKLPIIIDYLFQDIWLYLNLIAVLRNRVFDICIFGHPYNASLAYLFKKRHHIPTLIYDDWDFFPAYDRAVGVNGLSAFALSLIMRIKERICIRTANMVISVGSLLTKLRRAQGAKCALTVPNGVDYEMFSSVGKKSKEGIQPTLLYIGTLSLAWGVDLCIDAIPLIKKEVRNIRYLIVGEGPDEKYLRSKAKRLGVEKNVLFVGKQQYCNLPVYLSQSHIGIAAFRPNDFRKYAFPLKVIEYMASGLPVIATKVGETEQILADSRAGILIDFSHFDLSEAVFKLLKDDAFYALCRERALDFSKNYDWNCIIDKALASCTHIRGD